MQNLLIYQIARRDEEGHVILGPRNFTTKRQKVGSKDHVMFSKSSYVTVEDLYKPALEKVLRTEVKDGHIKAGHEIAFKPAKVVREKPYKAPYEHMTDRVEVKKEYKDADGKVITEPKNFYTTPAKIGLAGTKK